MTIDNMLHIIAGIFIIASVALGHFVSPYFFYFTAFVGLNLLQSGISRWCPMMTILRWMSFRQS
jgi:hypothetical protein